MSKITASYVSTPKEQARVQNCGLLRLGVGSPFLQGWGLQFWDNYLFRFLVEWLWRNCPDLGGSLYPASLVSGMRLKNITRVSQSVYKGKPAPECLATEHSPSTQPPATVKTRLWDSEFNRERQTQPGCDSGEPSGSCLCRHPQWRNLLISSAHRHELMCSSPGSSFLRQRDHSPPYDPGRP